MDHVCVRPWPLAYRYEEHLEEFLRMPYQKPYLLKWAFIIHNLNFMQLRQILTSLVDAVRSVTPSHTFDKS